MNILLKLIAIILISSVAHAHDVDRIHQIKAPHLGLSDPAYKTVRDDYWHCRRELVTVETVDYAICVGKLTRQFQERKWGEPVYNLDLLHYWNILPAHPCADEAFTHENICLAENQNRIANCKAHLDACVFTRNVFAANVLGCNETITFIDRFFPV